MRRDVCLVPALLACHSSCLIQLCYLLGLRGSTGAGESGLGIGAACHVQGDVDIILLHAIGIAGTFRSPFSGRCASDRYSQVLQIIWFGMICRVAWRVISGQGADDERSGGER
jgi:hypothetical protein